ncbi:metal-dependent hydrolase family protein [Streptomyces sp. 142MFCol3.1]|uniref:metal-dependent hydrolase family protein n=1 Tax=Streptomyces sp. 142MFCol3.1 TaxID=1172179 RepID=UPI0018F8AE90|nr:amidohydrolase family protein [Streptomyces sp. 142MFCol3.1]
MPMNSFAIHAGSMFDGFSLSGPATVYVSGDRIVRVDRTGALPAYGSEVIDLGRSACLLPGLIDTHVHLAFDAGPDPVTSLVSASVSELLVHMRAAARSALLAGVTTVRDLGDPGYLSLTLVEEMVGHPELGPEILAAGPPLTTPGGHCHFFGGEVEGAEALRAAVREHHARGCAVIKIMASGGHMTPDSVAPHASQYGLADLRVVVDEAHRLGLPVAAHAHGIQAISDAVEAGVDSLEHVSFLSADGIAPDHDLIDTIVRKGTFVSLTLGQDPSAAVQIPEAVAEFVDALLDIYSSLHKHGANVVIGSDAGIGPAKPHNVLPHGVADLTRLGVAPLDALISMTSSAARLCRVEGRKGRIAAGADADILVVTGNPAEDPAAILDVQAVFRAGIRVR